MQTRFTPASSSDPAVAASEPILRKCVHCGFCIGDVPDVRPARRRARQPARPDLPDQGHARERPARDGRRRAARRPLLELPLVHDDVPVGRSLPASRSITRACTSSSTYRRPLARALAARRARRRCCRIRGACAQRWPRPLVAAVRARCLPAPLRAMLELAPRRRATRAEQSRTPSPRALAPRAQARRARHGLRADRHRARDQCRDDSPARALRRRGRRASTAAAARSCITWARSARERAWRPRSSSGCTPSSTAPASTRSSRTLRVAARTSRIYGYVFRDDAQLASRAAAVAAKARDVTEAAGRARLAAVVRGARQAHRRLSFGVLDAARAEGRAAAAPRCSRPPDSQSRRSPKGISAAARRGLTTFCSPELATRLRERKLAHVARTRADVVATGNVGCITQLAAGAGVARRAHGRAARLGDGRAAAAGARGRHGSGSRANAARLERR